MVGEILSEIQDSVKRVTLVPSDSGRFEWTVNGDLVYSKKKTGRYPELRELKELIYAKLE